MPNPTSNKPELTAEEKLLLSTVVTLANQLSPDRRDRLLRELTESIQGAAAGAPKTASIIVQAALVISHQYLSLRTPLHLTDALFDQWPASAHNGAAECSNVQCGYRMPEDHAACVLCGSPTGVPGVFEAARKRMASQAGWN
jgi:hypothetical protein